MAKVYVSSTIADLEAERRAVMDWLIAAGHQPVHSYRPDSDTVRDSCLEDIETCDLYVLLLCHRYGFQPPDNNPNQLSITHLEFRRAGERGVPRIALLRTAVPDVNLSDLTDPTLAQLVFAFRSEVKQALRPGMFKDTASLIQALSTGVPNELSKLMQRSRGLEPWLAGHSSQLLDAFTKHIGPGEGMSAPEAERRHIDLLVRPRGETEPTPLSSIVSTPGARLIVVGEGGAGKTTKLLKLAADAARLAVIQPEAPVPIYFPLNLFDAVGREFDGLLDAMSRFSGIDRQGLYDLWAQQTRPLLFLFDGANEIRRELQAGCRSALRQLALRGTHRIVITSLPGSEAEELTRAIPDCVTAEVMQIDEDQIQQFFQERGVGDLYDRLDERLKALCANPFLLWAITQSCAGLEPDRLPANIGQLYRTLIDDYIFGQRESIKPEEARSTLYNYELVKKPILARLALDMCRRGVTRQPMDRVTLEAVKQQLEALRAEYEGILPLEPATLMPEHPAARAVLDEALRNGVLRAANDGFEYIHQSVRDYFAAVELAHLPIAEVIAATEPLIWRHVKVESSDDALAVTGVLSDSLVMLSGSLPDSSELISGLRNRHPLLAAYCLASASRCREDVKEEAIAGWIALLDRRKERYPWVACHCLRIVKPESPAVAQRLAAFIRTRKAGSAGEAACRALGNLPAADVIRSLVDTAFDESSEPDQSDPWPSLIFELDSAVAVSHLFDTWRDPSQSRARIRRAKSLLASMRQSLVRRVLQSTAAAAEERGDREVSRRALSASDSLESWAPAGVMARVNVNVARILESARKIETLLPQIRRDARQEMEGWSADKLRSTLRESEQHERRPIALELLLQRGACDLDQLLHVIAEDDVDQMREIAASALAGRQDRDAVFETWQKLVLDPQWPIVLRLPADFGRDLDAEGGHVRKLTKRWETAFTKAGFSINKQPDVFRIGDEWWIDCNLMSYGELSSRSYRVRTTGDLVAVEAASWQPRLVEAAPKLGAAAVPVLQQLLERRNPVLEDPVLIAFGSLGTNEAVDSLEEQTRESMTRRSFWTAVQALGRTRNPRAIAPLVLVLDRIVSEIPTSRVLEDDHGGESYWYGPDGVERSISDARKLKITVSALADLQATDAILRFCKEALDSGPESARWAAAMALRHWPKRDATLNGLAYQMAQDPSSAVRRCGVLLAGARKDETARVVLRHAIIEDTDREIRSLAADALRGFDDDEAITGLLGLIGSSDEQRMIRAVEALAMIDDDAVVPHLLPLLQHESEAVRVFAAQALNQLEYDGLQTLIDVVTAVIKTSNDPANRRRAARTLRGIPGGEDTIQSAVDQEDWRRVIDLIGTDSPLGPDDVQLLLWRGFAFFAFNKFDRALQDFDAVVELEPFRDYIHALRAGALDGLGQCLDAVEAARKAAESAPDDADHKVDLGWYAYKAGLYDESVAASRRALALDPDAATAAFNTGLALLAQGHAVEAREAYSRALDLCARLDEEKRRAEVKAALGNLEELARARPEHAMLAEELQRLLVSNLKGHL